MKETIVPDGWSQAFASLVMDDWKAVLNNQQPPARDLPKKLPARRAGVNAFLRAATEMPEPFELPADAGCKWAIVSKTECGLQWSSPEARLRAWAAVGAPVIPPDDGQVRGVIVLDAQGRCLHMRRFKSDREASIYCDGLVDAEGVASESSGIFQIPEAIEHLRPGGVDSSSIAPGELDRVLKELSSAKVP